MGREIFFLKKKLNYNVLPDCNPNDEENSHKLKIRAASSKNKKMNFRLEIQMVRRNSTSPSSNNCIHWCGEKIASWNEHFNLKYCQYTMTSIQMIKRIRISSKFELLPCKIGWWTSVSNKTDSEFILIPVAMWAKHKQSEIQMVKRNSTHVCASSNNCLH